MPSLTVLPSFSQSFLLTSMGLTTHCLASSIKISFYFFHAITKIALTLVRIRMLEINRRIGHANVAGDVTAVDFLWGS